MKGVERIHSHMFIGGPIRERFDLTDSDEFLLLEKLFKQEWQKTKWGYDEVDLRLIAKKGEKSELPSIARKRWKSYVLKDYDPDHSDRLIFAGATAPDND